MRRSITQYLNAIAKLASCKLPNIGSLNTKSAARSAGSFMPSTNAQSNRADALPNKPDVRQSHTSPEGVPTIGSGGQTVTPKFGTLSNLGRSAIGNRDHPTTALSSPASPKVLAAGPMIGKQASANGGASLSVGKKAQSPAMSSDKPSPIIGIRLQAFDMSEDIAEMTLPWPIIGAQTSSLKPPASRPSVAPIASHVSGETTISKISLADVVDQTIRCRKSARGKVLDQKLRDFARYTRSKDPMNLGTKRGKQYATDFVAQFVAWYPDGALPGARHGHELALLAHGVFAPDSKLEMPIVRNFLGALKRHPGVKVEKHCRRYGEQGEFLGKGTFYTITNATGSGN